MERSSEHKDVAVALAEVRPTPRDNFAAELDELVAAGFPRKSRSADCGQLGRSARAFATAPARCLRRHGTHRDRDCDSRCFQHRIEPSADRARATRHEAVERLLRGAVFGGTSAGRRRPVQSSAGAEVRKRIAGVRIRPHPESASNTNSSPASLCPPRYRTLCRDRPPRRSGRRRRRLGQGLQCRPRHSRHRSALDDHRGQKRRGALRPADPKREARRCLAAFSAIDEVRSRHEATADITKPTIATSEELRDSRARIDSLLAQLSTAEIESEREAIETELRGERRHAATPALTSCQTAPARRLLARLAANRTRHPRWRRRAAAGESATPGPTPATSSASPAA